MISLTLDYLVDLYLRVYLAVSPLVSVPALRLVFEHDGLFTLGLSKRCGFHQRSLDCRVSDYRIAISSDEQHSVELYGVALRHAEAFNLYGLLWRHLVLPARYLNYSVNLLTSMDNWEF